MTRGAPLFLLPRYCFTSFTDVEQEEAGDTTSHTFLIAPWIVGEKRWYYFLGTISGVESKSRSALFEYTRVPVPTTAIFYCDKDPEVSSVDGHAARQAAPWTWATIRSGAGNMSSDSGSTLNVRMQTYQDPYPWTHIYRSAILFDTSPIPLGATIISARVKLFCGGKVDSLNCDPSFTIVYSYPLSNTAIVPEDYQRFGGVSFSTIMTYTALQVDAWNTFHINDAGLPYIIRGGITRLGIREYRHDASNHEPTVLPSKEAGCYFRSADWSDVYRPQLEVTYMPP